MEEEYASSDVDLYSDDEEVLGEVLGDEEDWGEEDDYLYSYYYSGLRVELSGKTLRGRRFGGHAGASRTLCAEVQVQSARRNPPTSELLRVQECSDASQTARSRGLP